MKAQPCLTTPHTYSDLLSAKHRLVLPATRDPYTLHTLPSHLLRHPKMKPNPHQLVTATIPLYLILFHPNKVLQQSRKRPPAGCTARPRDAVHTLSYNPYPTPGNSCHRKATFMCCRSWCAAPPHAIISDFDAVFATALPTPLHRPALMSRSGHHSPKLPPVSTHIRNTHFRPSRRHARTSI